MFELALTCQRLPNNAHHSIARDELPGRWSAYLSSSDYAHCLANGTDDLLPSTTSTLDGGNARYHLLVDGCLSIKEISGMPAVLPCTAPEGC